MILPAEKWATTNQLFLGDTGFLCFCLSLFCWTLESCQNVRIISGFYSFMCNTGQHVLHDPHVLCHIQSPSQPQSIFHICTAFAGALPVYLPWMCVVRVCCITPVVHSNFIFVFSEEYAILEGVLSSRSGGFEPCTGAGLPLEGASCHILLSTWIRRRLWLSSAANGCRCP